MHRRHRDKNIPTELLRALVTVVDSGGFTRAADALDLTQSAISTQLKRLSNILGGDIFEKGRGLTLTKRGSFALSYARRMLGINDELLSLAGRHPTHNQMIVGLPAWMDAQTLAAIFRRCKATSPDQKVIFKCERADVLLKDLNARSIPLDRAALLGQVTGSQAQSRCAAAAGAMARHSPRPCRNRHSTKTQRAILPRLFRTRMGKPAHGRCQRLGRMCHASPPDHA